MGSGCPHLPEPPPRTPPPRPRGGAEGPADTGACAGRGSPAKATPAILAGSRQRLLSPPVQAVESHRAQGPGGLREVSPRRAWACVPSTSPRRAQVRSVRSRRLHRSEAGGACGNPRWQSPSHEGTLVPRRLSPGGNDELAGCPESQRPDSAARTEPAGPGLHPETVAPSHLRPSGPQ